MQANQITDIQFQKNGCNRRVKKTALVTEDDEFIHAFKTLIATFAVGMAMERLRQKAMIDSKQLMAQIGEIIKKNQAPHKPKTK